MKTIEESAQLIRVISKLDARRFSLLPRPPGGAPGVAVPQSMT